MNSIRSLSEVITGRNAIDGAGVHLVRIIGGGDHSQYDPFLLLDAFDSRNPDDYIRGFPMHPHRGIETLTYLVDGCIKHQDSLGHKGTIYGGDCQWMTAGKAILHQEMPQPANRLRGLQLWINLHAKHKMVAPKYRNITSGNLPSTSENGVAIKIIAGMYKGKEGAARGEYIDALFIDINMPAQSEWSMELPEKDTAFIYMLDGQANFGPADARLSSLSTHQGGLLSHGSTATAKASSHGARFVLFSGTPIKEPVAWGGPIVMNTEQELRQAFQELEDGTFGK